MTVKIAILKSGENIISDIKEAYSDDVSLTYVFEKPCKVLINGTYKVLDDEDSQNKVSISLHNWPTLSNDQSVLIPTDWVVTIVEPKEEVKLMYETEILKKGDKNDQVANFTEQSDSGLSD
jgi:hypothetical protein